MSVTVVVGAQWGDEGKGKITDILAGDADLVVRYQGGSNAGHTVIVQTEEFKLHLIPSGILREDCICLMGGGTVIDPLVLAEEIENLQLRGHSCENLRVSYTAHVVMPYHKQAHREAGRTGPWSGQHRHDAARHWAGLHRQDPTHAPAGAISGPG